MLVSDARVGKDARRPPELSRDAIRRVEAAEPLVNRALHERCRMRRHDPASEASARERAGSVVARDRTDVVGAYEKDVAEQDVHFQRFKLARDVGKDVFGFVQVVGVQEGDDTAGREPKTSIERLVRSAVGFGYDRGDVRTVLPYDAQRVVRRTPVDDDVLDVGMTLAPHAGKSVCQRGRTVLHRRDDRDSHVIAYGYLRPVTVPAAWLPVTDSVTGLVSPGAQVLRIGSNRSTTSNTPRT